MKQHSVALMAKILFFILTISTYSQDGFPDELALRKYAVGYLFYHYEINDLLYRPIRIIADNIIIQVDSLKKITIPLKSFNYLHIGTDEINYKGYKHLLVIDLCKQKPRTKGAIPDSSVSLIGRSKWFLYNDDSWVKPFKKGADFFNSLFEDSQISYDELQQKINRTPYFFSTIDSAFNVILKNLALIKNCKGGVHIVDGGVLVSPENNLSRTLYFNKLTSVSVSQLQINTSEPDTIFNNYMFLYIDRQIGEKNNTFFNGDSTFGIPLYLIDRRYQDKAYQLVDALVYMAMY